MKERKNNYYKERLKGERDILEECNTCIPNIETEIENLMKEFYITRYDYKVTHLLTDLVQAEVLKILKKTKSIKKERENNIKYDWKDKWSQMKSVRFENKENNQNEKEERETQTEKGIEKEEISKRKEGEGEGEEIDTINTNNSTYNYLKMNKQNDEKEESREKEEKEGEIKEEKINVETKEGEIKEENSKQTDSNTDIDPNVKNKNNEEEIVKKEEQTKEETTDTMQIIKEPNSTDTKKEEDKNVELSINENEYKEEEGNDPPNSLNKTETEKDMEKQQHNKELEELLYVDDISVKLAIREYVLQNINRKKNVDFLYQDHHTVVNKYNEENSHIVERNISYPNSLPPYLPDDCSVNTILPSWDLNYIPNGLKK